MSIRTADEIKLDLEDLEGLLPHAKRQKTKDILSLEVRKLQSELVNLKEKETKEFNKKSETSTGPKCYNVKLTNYAWDESEKFMKLYVTLKNVQALPADNLSCDFSERSLHLRVNGLDNKNYELLVSNLCDDIEPGKCSIKVKTDMIVVFLAKKVHKRWSHVTVIEKRMKEAKTSVPEFNDNADPESSLMNLMKKMYQDGDDDMKRTIAKAWTESQDKKTSLQDFPKL